jgi:hypothetical protein
LAPVTSGADAGGHAEVGAVVPRIDSDDIGALDITIGFDG